MKPERRRPFGDPKIEASLRDAAELAAASLLRHHGRRLRISYKGAIDLVTRADTETEERVLKFLRRRHPDHDFIAEESSSRRAACGSGYTWFIDPLDGTTNFAHGLEHFAFSLAVAWDGQVVGGIVADPCRGRLYHALRGRGAYCDGRRLRVSRRRRLAECILATGFPYDRRRRLPELMALFGAFVRRVQGMRRFGVASLDLALVAAGQFDGFYEASLHAWDVAAGMLLVTEAGGVITDYEGRPFHPFSPSVLAAGPDAHRAMLGVIRRVLTDDAA